MNRKVSLYIPCYNAAPFLDRVLPAALAQTHPLEEVLVIDDGSTDATAAVARRHAAGSRTPLRAIEQGRNRGLGAARNTGVRAVGSEFVACLDADVVAQPGWLAACMAEFDDPRVVGVGGNLVEDHVAGVANHWRDTYMRQSRGEARVVDPPFLWGSNAVFRRRALLDVGLYDESCRTNGEDVPVSRALQAAGQRLVYTPAARCHHQRRDTLRSILDTNWRWYYFGNWMPVTFRSTCIANNRNFRFVRDKWPEDWRRRDWGNLLVDSVLPVYRCWRDWQSYLRERRPRPDTSAA